MGIKIGDKELSTMLVGTGTGNKEIKEVWQGTSSGNKLVWQSIFIPEGYVLATDDDFSGASNGNFRYIGTDEYVMIPNKIKGVPVTSYATMFYSYEGLQLKGVASFNEKLISMGNMFHNSSATTLDLSNFDTSNVTNMSYMFRNSSATTLDVSSFDTSKVTNMRDMFRDSSATTLDLSNFDTSKVTNMSYMFRDSSPTTLDLSSFDTSKVTNMSNMFLNSSATVGYARTQADADRFNASSGKPAGLTFSVIGFAPGISISKVANKSTYIDRGELIIYTITVINTGTTALTDVVVNDPKIPLTGPSGDTNNNGILDVGETWTYTGNYLTTAADIRNRQIINEATVNSSQTNDVSADYILDFAG